MVQSKVFLRKWLFALEIKTCPSDVRHSGVTIWLSGFKFVDPEQIQLIQKPQTSQSSEYFEDVLTFSFKEF